MTNSIVPSNFNNSENNSSPFDAIRGYRADGSEYWTARELMKWLGYTSWKQGEIALNRAIKSISNQGHDVTSNIVEVCKLVSRPSRGNIEIIDFELSRFACYVVAMNADPDKEMVAMAQGYFAMQTRKTEISGSITPVVIARQLPPIRDAIEYLQASKDVVDIVDPILKACLIQLLAEEMGASKALPPSSGDVLVIAAVKARSLGYALKPGEDGKLGKWVAKHCNPLGKTQHGRYEVNVYRDDDRLVETIGAFFA